MKNLLCVLLVSFIFFSRGNCNLECHTCNSVDTRGCEKDKFDPQQPTNTIKSCQESTNKIALAFQTHFFSDFHTFPTDKFTPAQAQTTSKCVKFTVLSRDHSKKVTFRGCSTLGEHTCAVVQHVGLNVNASVDHCSNCDTNYCNGATTVAASIFTAIIALIIAHNF